MELLTGKSMAQQILEGGNLSELRSQNEALRKDITGLSSELERLRAERDELIERLRIDKVTFKAMITGTPYSYNDAARECIAATDKLLAAINKANKHT